MSTTILTQAPSELELPLPLPLPISIISTISTSQMAWITPSPLSSRSSSAYASPPPTPRAYPILPLELLTDIVKIALSPNLTPSKAPSCSSEGTGAIPEATAAPALAVAETAEIVDGQVAEILNVEGGGDTPITDAAITATPAANPTAAPAVPIPLESQSKNEDGTGDPPPLFFSTKRPTRLASLHGMLSSCKYLREVVLREWFRLLRVRVNDWRFVTEMRGRGFDILPCIRELYIHDWSLLSIQNMSAMSSLRSVSYPIGADHPLLAKFPNYLTILEFREVEVVTEPLLEMIAGTFKELRRLRIDCGEEGPYEPLACDDEGKTAVDLAMEYSTIFRDLKYLEVLSLDVALAPPAYAPGPGHSSFKCAFKCSTCWELKRDTARSNEETVVRALVSQLPRLKVVEWACWIREPTEYKTRISILREVMEDGAELRWENVKYTMLQESSLRQLEAGLPDS